VPTLKDFDPLEPPLDASISSISQIRGPFLIRISSLSEPRLLPRPCNSWVAWSSCSIAVICRAGPSTEASLLHTHTSTYIEYYSYTTTTNPCVVWPHGQIHLKQRNETSLAIICSPSRQCAVLVLHLTAPHHAAGPDIWDSGRSR
jgi:hypothetical protein